MAVKIRSKGLVHAENWWAYWTDRDASNGLSSVDRVIVWVLQEGITDDEDRDPVVYVLGFCSEGKALYDPRRRTNFGGYVYAESKEEAETAAIVGLLLK